MWKKVFTLLARNILFFFSLSESHALLREELKYLIYVSERYLTLSLSIGRLHQRFSQLYLICLLLIGLVSYLLLHHR